MAIDIGGIISSILTLVFVIIGPLLYYTIIMGKKLEDFPAYLKGYLNSGSVSRFMITCALLATSVIAVWLTIRAGGVLIENLFAENYPYSQFQILDLISNILIINLSFGLVRSLRKETNLRDIAEAAIQALLIGVIVFLPRNSSTAFLETLGARMQGVIGFLMISVSIALILISLTIFWKYIGKCEQKD